MASCWILVGLVLVALAFISSAISFVVPYWVHHDATGQDVGLFGECRTISGECTWAFQNEFAWERSRQEWHYATQALFAGGMLVLIFAFIFSCVSLCSACCPSKCPCLRIVSGHLIVAFLLIGGAVAVFGVFSNKELYVSVSGSNRYYWGYWVGVIGAIFTGAAAFLYTFECCRGRSHDGYTRGAVV